MDLSLIDVDLLVHQFNSTTKDKPQGVAGQRLDVMDDPISGDMTDPCVRSLPFT